MAAGAEIRDLGPLRRALERLVLGLVGVVLGGVPAVAVLAGQAELLSGCPVEVFGRSFELVVELGVALEAAVLLGEDGPGARSEAIESRPRRDDSRGHGRSPLIVRVPGTA